MTRKLYINKLAVLVLLTLSISLKLDLLIKKGETRARKLRAKHPIHVEKLIFFGGHKLASGYICSVI